MAYLFGYIGFYKGKRAEVLAESKLKAQTKLAVIFKTRKPWEVAVVLAEVNGISVTHSTSTL